MPTYAIKGEVVVLNEWSCHLATPWRTNAWIFVFVWAPMRVGGSPNFDWAFTDKGHLITKLLASYTKKEATWGIPNSEKVKT
jgi:hypothetical protein